MKAFIRKLSIKERKGYVNSIIYTIFSFLHIIITKSIFYHSKISFITLIFISGSLLIMMSFYRIFRLMKKFKSIQKENIKMNFMVGLTSFLSFFFLIASIDSTSLTNIVFISRLYPFLVMLNHTLTKPENISNHQLVSFIIYFFSFLIIFFPALYQDTGFGVVYALLSIIFKFSSLTYLFVNGDSALSLLYCNRLPIVPDGAIVASIGLK